MSILANFEYRLRNEWLLAYCQDPKRNYDPIGFKQTLLQVGAADARDCMLALDNAVVIDTGGGRYRAKRSATHEVLFWEGRRSTTPRPITLWLEPVITFAALARLHFTYNWPKGNLAMQPKGAFDFAAHAVSNSERIEILGEVKKTSSELRQLQENFLALSSGIDASCLPENSTRKWNNMLKEKPHLLWLVGPMEESYTYAVDYTTSKATLAEVDIGMLAYSAA